MGWQGRGWAGKPPAPFLGTACPALPFAPVYGLVLIAGGEKFSTKKRKPVEN